MKHVTARMLFGFAALGMLGSGGSAWAAKKPEITIKAAHTVAVSNSQHTPFAKFKEVVEKMSDGRIAVEIFPHGQRQRDRCAFI